MPDREEWSEHHRKRVALYYGFIVGGLLVIAGSLIILEPTIKGNLDNRTAGMGGALVLLGLVAGMPQVFMPVFSAILRKLPWGRGDEPRIELVRDDEPK